MKGKLLYNNDKIAIDISPEGGLEEDVFNRLIEKVDGRGSLLEVIIKDGKIKVREKAL